MNPSPPDGTFAPTATTIASGSTAVITGNKKPATIAGDILHGADEIALFLFGDRKHRRRVYNLVDGNGLPVFRIGVNICARKSILLEWIAAQERVSVAGGM